ncbi:MAG: HDIG domain-containing protein [Clostridia bacterium]|nr:HDIG domain-containing protein [Clostridia bacterium]
MKTKNDFKFIWQLILLSIVTCLLSMGFWWLTILRHTFDSQQALPTVAFFVTTILFFAVFTFYFGREKSRAKFNIRHIFAIYAVFFFSMVIVYFASTINCYFAPFIVCVLILTQMVGVNLAVFVNIVQILMFFLATSFGTKYSIYQLIVCLFLGLASITVALFYEKKQKDRLGYLTTGLKVSVMQVVIVTLFYLIFAGKDSFSWYTYTINVSMACLGGLVNVMIMFLFIPLLERVFNVTTNFRLAELSNTNHPLLLRLLKEAPGTFNHSLTVANYAEACAMAIGENTYLARAAGCYHDIGKLQNPIYFSENQSSGYNPHNEIAPEVSVSFLKNHVNYGVNLVREYHLPAEIESAINEHHGTFVMRYFYQKAQKYTEGDLPLQNYCYEGMTPRSKINGILMIVDACEATLRSLSVSDKAKAEEIVDQIVNERMDFGQFDNSDLSIKEIDIIKQTIISTYLGAKHERVKYPELKYKKMQSGKASIQKIAELGKEEEHK